VRGDHEELLARNPALGACAFWHLARSFSNFSEGKAPGLPYFILGAGMIFHKSTVQKIHRMQFESGIVKAASEMPDIVAGLQRRIQEYSPIALLALQVGSTSGILRREGGDGFATFRALGNDLPLAIRIGTASVPEILNSAKRLGAWFASEPIQSLRRNLSIEF
jgi:hypothetical protein